MTNNLTADDLTIKANRYIDRWLAESHDYRAIINGMQDKTVLVMYGISDDLSEVIINLCNEKMKQLGGMKC